LACKFCGSDKTVRNGLARGKQLSRCKDCKHQYLDNGAFVGMRTKTEVIASALNLYYDGLSTWRIQRQIAKIFRVDVSPVSVWKWIMKYSELVSDYVATLNPSLSGKYHHDETEIRVGGEDRQFGEMIDADSRFLVAHLLTKTRTSDDARKVLTQTLQKQRPIPLFTHGSFAYDEAFKKVFYTRYQANQVEGGRRVGIKARETNNIIERKHGTLKDRLRPARGLKHDETARTWLDGCATNSNFVKPPISLKGQTPAQAAGLNVEADWGHLIKQATLSETKRYTNPIEVIVK